MWIGERITENGVGNGISIVLIVNIISRLPVDLNTLFEQFIKGKRIANGILAGVVIAAVIIAIVLMVVILQGAERKIPVQYSKQLRGKRTYGGQSTHIPLKVNTGGVMPVIFAQSLMQTPVIICSFLQVGQGTGFWPTVLRCMSESNWFNKANWIYTLGAVLYLVLIIAFAYFYTSITFNPLEIADNMKKSGGFISGIRPGKPTSDYLTSILNYIILIGAIGLSIVSMLPIILNGLFNANVSFGGTSIIIIVGVVIETLQQIESQMLVRNYKGFLSE
jgi:preprotein translocase subunit SecY